MEDKNVLQEQTNDLLLFSEPMFIIILGYILGTIF